MDIGEGLISLVRYFMTYSVSQKSIPLKLLQYFLS